MEFTYGKSDLSNQEGAGEITTSWKTHSAKQTSDDNNPRDFKKLNKRAILDGMITAKDNYKYRKTHDNRIPFGLDALKTRGLSLPNETFTYGRRNRPQTPVKGIILNHYGETAGNELQQKYKAIKDYKRHASPRNNTFEIRYTNAQMKADEFIKTKTSVFDEDPAKKEFKLKRFQNIEPRVAIAKPGSK